MTCHRLHITHYRPQGEIPGLLEPMTASTPEALLNDAADLVIGFRSFGQMPFYRRFGRAVLDIMTGAGGAVTDSQSGFRALNRKAVGLLVGTLRKDDSRVESEMMRRSRDLNLRMAEVQIQCRYGDFDTSAKNPVSHGFGVRGLGDLAHRREETTAVYRGSWIHYVSGRGLLWDTTATGYNQTRFFSFAYAMLVAIFLILGAIGVFMGLMLNVISRLRVGEGGRG